MKSLMLVLIAVLTIGVMAGVAMAQEPPISFTGLLEENFDSLGATGTVLPDGWIAGYKLPEEESVPTGPYIDADLTVGDGTSETKGIHFNVGTTGDSDRCIGGHPTSGSGDGGMQVALKNDTGAPLTSIKITYTGEQWKDWQATSTQEALNPDGSENLTERLIMFISDADDFSGNVERLPVEFDFNRVKNTSGSTTILDGNLPENRTENIGGEYTFVNPIPAGGIFYITWHDFESDGTNDHLLCIDDVAIISDSLKPVYPENGGWVVFDDPSIYLEWHRPDPNGPLPPAPYNVDVYLGTNNPLQAGDRIETNVDIDTTTNFGLPLLDATTYYWRVDTYEPNALTSLIDIKEGPTWSFATVVPAAIFVDKAEVQVSEEGPTSDTYTITLSKEPAQPVTITPGIPMVSPLDISTGIDDIEEHIDDGEIEGITSSDLELGREDDAPDQQLIGMRFTNIDIPTGATITSAYIEFNVDETDNTEEVNLTIFGQLAPDAPGITATAGVLTSMPRTVAEVDWTNIPVWDTAEVKKQTPDIVSIISEITSQAEWKFGNSLVLLVEPDADLGSTGKRVADSADSGAAVAPKLHIEWTVGTGTVTFPATWSPSSVVLDASNWETGAGIEVTAVDDSDLETDPHFFNLPNAVSSAAADWNVLIMDDIVVNILENECGAWDFAPYDFNTDCAIDLKDLAIFAEKFGTCSDPHFPALCEDAR